MVLAKHDPDGSGHQFVIRPNASLSWPGTKVLYWTMFAFSMSIATTFWFLGAWMVLPFAGLEMAALAAALYCCACRSARVEVVTIRGGDVEVAKGRRRLTERWRFQRHWAQVRLDVPGHEWYASRLRITCAGRSVEVGGCLGEEERRHLAGALSRALRSC